MFITKYIKYWYEYLKFKYISFKLRRQTKQLKKELENRKVDKELLLIILNDYIDLAVFTIKNIDIESHIPKLYKDFYMLNVKDELDKDNSVISDDTKLELIKLFGDENILRDYIKIKILVKLK